MKTFTKYLLGLALFATTSVKPMSLLNIKSFTFQGHVLPTIFAGYAVQDLVKQAYNLNALKIAVGWVEYAAKIAKDKPNDVCSAKLNIKTAFGKVMKNIAIDAFILFVAYRLYTN